MGAEKHIRPKFYILELVTLFCHFQMSNIGYDYQTSDRSGTTNDYTVSGLASTDVCARRLHK